jgi:alkylation response protein AidB-like acyl-CoA dehydrogenase
MTTTAAPAGQWLGLLLPGLPELTELAARRLARFEHTLSGLLATHPIGPGTDPRVRSQRLLAIRRDLAGGGYLAWAVPSCHGGAGGPAVAQTLAQFICGYHDADLRDATGLGHGRLIARHATPQERGRWLPRLLAGDLPGIAITEPHGGSQVHATTTAATAHRDGTWTLTGVKTWISRLTEAAVFIVFFTDPTGRLTAGVIDAAAGGLHRRPLTPAGLSGWAWGELHLREVRLHPSQILGHPGQGMPILREHFAHYRPLVAATALGVAAAAHDHIATHLQARRAAGTITSLRDNALITLGRTYAQINAALLAALTAQRLSESAAPRAQLWGCAIKAHATDTAYATTAELALLAGAGGFTASSPLTKAQQDLRALLYADGIHDSLYRSAGRTLTATTPAMLAAIPRPHPPGQVHNQLHA